MAVQAPLRGTEPPLPQGPLGTDRRRSRSLSLFDPTITRRALGDSVRKLDPRVQLRNPVMFVVLVGAVVTSVEVVRTLLDSSLAADRGFTLMIAIWLWFTVLFANFAEAMAEGRGKAAGRYVAQNPHGCPRQTVAAKRAGRGGLCYRTTAR